MKSKQNYVTPYLLYTFIQVTILPSLLNFETSSVYTDLFEERNVD
jgi:hypothetical protein